MNHVFFSAKLNQKSLSIVQIVFYVMEREMQLYRIILGTQFLAGLINSNKYI